MQFLLSRGIYKEEYLSVCLFAMRFNPSDSYDHQTFHDASLGPKERHREVNTTGGSSEGVG